MMELPPQADADVMPVELVAECEQLQHPWQQSIAGQHSKRYIA
jgi:hypothetical protein